MAAYIENIVDIDLSKETLHRSFFNQQISEGDQLANKFGVRAFRNGISESLSGASCIGYFIRADGITLVVNGTVSGNVAYVTLPVAAYAVTGTFTLAIKVTESGQSVTMRIVDGTVVNTTTGTIDDPSHMVPSVEELTALISQAEAAVTEINKWTIAAEVIEGTRCKITATKAS